jgi:hypothetical protein
MPRPDFKAIVFLMRMLVDFGIETLDSESKAHPYFSKEKRPYLLGCSKWPFNKAAGDKQPEAYPLG